MRPEAELLLCCARTQVDAERAARIEAILQEDMDWDYLLSKAHRHGVMPLLYRNLSTTCPEAVPGARLDDLRGRFHKIARRNVFLTGELLKLLNLLESHGISAVPFKGPALAASAYGNLALRQFRDLDLLIRKRHVPKAKDLLLSQGYRPKYRLTRRQETALLQFGYHYNFVHDNSISIVELHWEIRPKHSSFPLDPELLWERLRPMSLTGKEALAFSPEDLLLILCAHGSDSLWRRLQWICDVAELIRVSKEMDWLRVMEQAGELGSQRMLFLGLFLANDLLGTVLPEKIRQKVRADPSVKALAEQVRERLFREADSTPGIFERELFRLRARERLRDRVRYCVRLAITPTVGDWVLLPASLSPFYYILRPFRMMKKYGPSLLRRSL